MTSAANRPLTIHYRFWNKIHNIGDAITAPIVKDLIGYEPVVSGKRSRHVLAIGSILAFANENSVVWGSGVMDPSEVSEGVKVADFRAVRGFKTLRALQERRAVREDLAVGDPGVFVQNLIKIPEKTNGRIAVIPHHSSLESDIFQTASGSDETRLIDFRTNDLGVLEEIAAAEVVVSESLHGLIFAEAFGKPSVWVSTKKPAYWDFKFDDWHSTTEAVDRVPWKLRASPDWAQLARSAIRTPITFSKAKLLEAFPSDLAQPTHAKLVSYDRCRARSPALIEAKAVIPERMLGVSVSNSSELIDLLGETAVLGASKTARSQGKHAAEPTYAVVSFGDAASVDPQTLGALQSVMNKFFGFDAMFIHGKADQGPSDQALSHAGMIIDGAGRLSRSLIIRPGREIRGLQRIGSVYAGEL